MPAVNKAGSIMDYLGRYVYRVAISNERLLSLEDDIVTFWYRDSNDDDKIKTMRLEAHEFIRRFLCHILPEKFVKIRHYGFLGTRNKKTKLVQCKKLLGEEVTAEEDGPDKESWEELLERITGIDPRTCPECGKGKMGLKEKLPREASRSPP